MILLEMKIPQLSNPEATAARNQNSICDIGERSYDVLDKAKMYQVVWNPTHG